jgi:carboxyl-terminal processing protease
MAKRFDSIKNYKTNLTFTSLPYEEELFQNDTILKEKRDRWHSSLSKDVYVEEAIHVLADMKKNNIRQDKLAKVQD